MVLISNKENYSLVRGKKIPVTVRVENPTEHPIKLRHGPVFEFRRVGVVRSEARFGDTYIGRTPIRHGPVLIEERSAREYSVELTKLEVMVAHSSIDYWPNIFENLSDGDFYVWATATADFSSRKSKVFSRDVKEFASEAIVISFSGAKKK